MNFIAVMPAVMPGPADFLFPLSPSVSQKTVGLRYHEEKSYKLYLLFGIQTLDA